MKDLKQLSRIFKALSSPHRLDLYLKIKQHHYMDQKRKNKRFCFLSSICENLGLGAPTVSHHLKELVSAGLVETGKNGKFVTCSINQDVLKTLKKILDDSSKVHYIKGAK